jgi:cell division protein FtsN
MQFDIGRLGGIPMQDNNPSESKKPRFFRGAIAAAVILALALGLYFILMRMYPAQTPIHPITRRKIPAMPPSHSMQPAPAPSNPSMPTDSVMTTGESGNDNTFSNQIPDEAEQGVPMNDSGDNGIRATASPESETAPVPDAAMAQDQPVKEETSAQTDSIHSDAPSNAMEAPSFYTIQVGSYRSQNNAERQVTKLRKKGFDAYLFQLDRKDQQPWYLVRFGHFNSFDAAEQALASFKTQEQIVGAIKRLTSN